MTDEFILQIMDKFNSSEIVDLDLARGDNHISLSKKEACTSQWGQSKTEKIKNDELKIKNDELDFNNIEQSNSNDELESRQKGQSKLDTSQKGQSKPAESKPSETLNSPIVGTFYRAPSPDAPAYAEKGTKIKKGEPVCIIEAMKMMNTLNADYDFEVLEVLVENGELVEYDQPLLAIKKL